jgi:methylated-DNA-[protein]-cysteine S-methyltransferase
MTAIEAIHDLIEIPAPTLPGASARADWPGLAIVAAVAGDAVIELRLFASAAAALVAVPAAAPRAGAVQAPGEPAAPNGPPPAAPAARASQASPTSPRTAGLLREVRRQLAEYFAGERRIFDLPLAPRGTEFERRVWQEVAAIPYGTTRSYGQVAQAVGSPAAYRAVGRANGSNPIPLVIPCHRVIGTDGSLTGYGGGLPLKRYLLDLEGVKITPPSVPPDSRQLGLPLAAAGTAASGNQGALYGIVRP